MNTLLLITKDTITANVIRIIDGSQPYVQETDTNWADLSIANTICGNLFWIAVVCVAGAVLWKLLGILEQRWADCCKHKWDFKNRKFEQRTKLTERLLDFLKDKASEKNDCKGQQAKSQSQLMSPDEIYSLLRGNAAKTSAKDLRQQYIELCVEVLQKVKTDNNGGGCGEAGGSPGNTDGKTSLAPSGQSASSPTPTPITTTESDGGTSSGEQIVDHVNDGKSNDVLQSKNPSDIYKDVLCTLIGLIHKTELDKNNLDELKMSCGIETENPNSIPQNEKRT